MELEILDYNYYDGSIRPLYILRPSNFDPNIKYKTIYFFDGQSTFDKSEYTLENWGVEESFDKLNIDDYIAVGISHAGENRISEYLPYDATHKDKVIKSRHIEFDDFFINNIIPYIEDNYPVKKDKSARSLIGSSMGGFMTASYAAKYKDIFSNYGIFSLASFMANPIDFIDFIDQYELDRESKYFIYVGDKEGYNDKTKEEDKEISQAYIDETNKFMSYLLAKGINNYKLLVGQGENHSEKAWKKYIENCLEFFREK